MNRQQLQRSMVGKLTVSSFVSAMLQLCARDVHAAQLPVPCTGVACGTRAAPTNFVTSGAAAAIRNGNTLTVQQGSNTATLNWSSFNISADGKVAFNQPSSSSVALNRIYDSSPSSIFGSLSANGQLYLINANGVLFGAGSKVNVSGLIASSLNISDSTFGSGILSALKNSGARDKAALQQFTDCDFNPSNCTSTPIFNNGAVTVQAGAQIIAADQGRLTLAAPTVVNNGSLSAPDGQIILAAGQAVYLQASQDPALRGLVVQVDQNGKAWNQLAGQLSAPRGNVTLVGLAVNQDGRVSATTTVSANGSITLQAANTAVLSGTISASQGGQLEIGQNSVTEVLPEYSDKQTAVDAQTQLQSTISMTGERVLIHGGTIDAPSGKLNVLAAANPTTNAPIANSSAAEIRIDSGTTINLAGSDAEVPMSANLVTVQLRGNELADDPTQRNGALRGQTVTVDVRADNGTGTNIANVSSAIGAVGKNITQRTTAGGTASFQSEGDVVVAKGASIDVSGGKTTYDGGNIQTTMLVGTNGKLYDIAAADPLLTYTGVVNPTFTQTYDQWGVKEVVATPGFSHYEAGYVQGGNAGTVQFAAPSMALSGTLAALTVNGPYQRTAATEALGGTLIIGLPYGLLNRLSVEAPDFLSPAVSFTRAASPVVIGEDTPLPAQTLQLPVSYLTDDGFSNTQIYSNSRVTLPAGLPLDLVPGSSLLIQAPRIDINSSITSLAGNLTFQNVATVDRLDPALPRLGIDVGPGVALDVSGQWTNDSMRMGGPGTAPILQDAGSITLQLNTSGSELVLGNQSSLKADGGAWFALNSKVTSGKGGKITLDANPAQAAVDFGQGVAIEGFGVGTATGGTFSLTAPRISISQGNSGAWTTAQRADDLDSPDGVLDLYAPLFSNYGFSSISLAATGAAVADSNGDVLTVTSGTTINAQTRSWQLQSGLLSKATGGTVGGFAQALLLPDHAGPVTNVSFSVLRETPYTVNVPGDTGALGMQLGDRDFALGRTAFGNLDIQTGSSILADPGASLSFTTVGSLQIAGTLRAQGGSISATTSDFEGSAALFDPGYRADQGITVASSAILDVSGTTLYTPNIQNLPLGTVLPGGAITLNAKRGTVITEAGSLIDIRGTNASLYVPQANAADGYAHQVVASSGGSLTVGSMQSISLLGDLRAQGGVGNSGAAAAGSLEIDLARIDLQLVQDTGVVVPGFNPDPLEIELVDSTAGRSPSASDSNVAVLGIRELENSGIDSLTLIAGGRDKPTPGIIAINSNQPLTLARQITLDSSTYSVGSGFNASISAPYVQLGNSGQAGAAALPLDTGTLNVSAREMNLLGTFAFQGIAAATLTSSGDVQLEGLPIRNSAFAAGGQLTTAGNLTVNAARIYPDTATTFTLESDSTDGFVNIGQTAASAGAPLSAGGGLTIKAPNINVAGTLLAPFGSIDLEAQDSLTLANGSLVSVSGAGLDVLFGQTEFNGAQWIYQAAGGVVSGGIVTVGGVPAKQVSLNAPNITQQAGATINLQGGGDLHAYEFAPGTGGSRDRLAAGNVPGLYAIIPAMQGQMAPFDPQESASIGHTQTVYLSGIAGLPAGYYSLLPPRYALLPGASLVKVEPSYTSAVGGQIGTLADGTPVVGGYLTSGTTGLHTGVTQYEGFAIYPGSYGQQLASYNISNASSYFTAAAAAAGTPGAIPIPADAGTLNLNVLAALNNSLDLEGKVLTKAATGGRGALVNISAPELEVSSGSAGSGALTVSGSILQSWNASVLTLGGKTSIDPTSTNGAGLVVEVDANKVTVDSGVQLSADQILLVAQQGIDVQSGAGLFSTSGKNGTTLAKLPEATTVKLTDGAGADLPGGALLAVSDLAAPIVTRSGGVATGATINLESGSTLGSGGALTLDTPGAINVAGTVNGKGASWSLSSSSIAFTGSSGSKPDSLNIDSNLLASMQQAGAVRLASAVDIDILSSVSLGATSSSGTPTLSALTLIGAAINNKAGGDSILGAGTLTLQGLPPPSTSASGTTPAPSDPVPLPGSGTLSLVANNLNIGPGTMTVNGFGTTQAQVGGAIVGKGTGALNVGGGLTLNAVEITAAADSATKVTATGALTIGTPTQLAAGNTLPTLVGGDLTLSGSSIEDSGAIVVPSGLVQLTATTGNIHLGGTATIDASGRMLHAVDQSVGSSGGMVSLLAPGSITLDSGSILNVSGAGSAPAGSLNITDVNGLVDLSGTLLGKATNTTGGSFTLETGGLRNGLTALAANLVAGGFNNAVDVHVHNGDLALAANGTLTANNITLTADRGVVDIAGVLSAPSAAKRGFIGLFGGTGVGLEHTGQLHADGSGSEGHGGEIEISSTCPTCTVTLASGSQITAAGSARMGELDVRAPALVGTDDNGVTTYDVAVNVGSKGMGADVSRAGQVTVEAVKVDSNVTPATINSVLNQDVADAAAFLTAGAPGILKRLQLDKKADGLPDRGALHAGVEIQDSNANDVLTVNSLDLSQYSQQASGAQVIDVSVRAAGSLTLSGSISDGIEPSSSPAAVGQYASGSLSFVAGADVNSANPLATLFGSGADLTLAQSAIVRTGTGDLNLAAAHNVTFKSGASAYTTGIAAATADKVGSGTTARLMNFVKDGGNVLIDAGNDVVGAPVNGNNGNYSVTAWQIREGSSSNPAEYGVDLKAFDWNTGALGGGDVAVSAGHSVNNLSAAAADSLTSAVTDPGQVSTKYGAGGGLTVTAGRDIGSAQVYVADGVGTLTMGGGLTSVRSYTPGQGQPVAVGSSFALGDSQVSVWARQDVLVNAIYNPTMILQPGTQSSANNPLRGQYFTYGADAGLNLESTAGNVTLDMKTDTISQLVGASANSGNNIVNFAYLPPSLAIRSLQGDLNLSATRTGNLLADPTGELVLYAGRDMIGTNGGIVLSMMDNLAATVPTAASPGITFNATIGAQAFAGNIHAGDPNPVLVTAGRDITGLNVSIPKAAQIAAGRDIVNLRYAGQNTAPGDTTLVTAGRDVIAPGSGSTFKIQVGGPGSLDVFAGRNVNLGFSDGITTVGNLRNPNLPSSAGADINVLAGLGTTGGDYSDFLDKIITPSTGYQQDLVAYVESQTGQSGLTYAQAQTSFAGFTTAEQSPVIEHAFFNELTLSGREANNGTGTGFKRGYAAIDALFPNSRTATASGASPYAGNLNLIYSQIYTQSGGNISLLVPGGQIDVGLAVPPTLVSTKQPSALGIVAEGPGNVDIYAKGDVNVNSSRIFTLGGGNILIWSNEGNIDAGKGSKSSLSVPPPVVSVDSTGQIRFNYGGAVAGSGIRTIQTQPTTPAGDVDLVAPVGTVDAGDAGIGAAGNINLAAQHVIGASNINFGGKATGVPPDVGNLGASLSSATAAASSSTSSATSSLEESRLAKQDTAPLAQTALGWLDVFVTGLGEENCKTDDAECLKRQKTVQ